MIGKLTGLFGGTLPDGTALVEVGGVGYAVRTPLLALEALRGAKTTAVSLFIHTAVRDDAIDLYGFPTEGDLAFFKQLMTVKGLGPKTALSIMSVADTQTLKSAIAGGDSSMLTKVFGIGKKSAERMVVELRDKMQNEVAAGSFPTMAGGDSEVIEALMALGYQASECRVALKEVPPIVVGTSARLAATLRLLGTKK